MVIAIILLVVGLFIAIAAQYAAQVAEQRSKRTYDQLLATRRKIAVTDQEEQEYSEPKPPSEPRIRGQRIRSDVSGIDVWSDIRTIVGFWGCLYLVLEFLRGFGILVFISSSLYIILKIFSA